LAHRVASNIDAGIIWINDHHKNDPSSPWGGFKDSGNHFLTFYIILFIFYHIFNNIND
jgi:acyl-CoA reductase-like NAD-dependent aldehyde dehydrogenase